jgi:hypothetical protein
LPGCDYDYWSLLVVLLAGPSAEAKVGGASLFDALMFNGSDDWQRAAGVMEELVAGRQIVDIDSGWARVERDVARFIRKRWRDVERVAIALLERGALEAHEVAELLK